MVLADEAAAAAVVLLVGFDEEEADGVAASTANFLRAGGPMFPDIQSKQGKGLDSIQSQPNIRERQTSNKPKFEANLKRKEAEDRVLR